jgi:hypothetical protein
MAALLPLEIIPLRSNRFEGQECTLIVDHFIKLWSFSFLNFNDAYSCNLKFRNKLLCKAFKSFHHHF